MSVLEIVLVCVLSSIVAFAAVKWLFKKDTEQEGRRRSAAELAAVLTGLGLRKTPAFLIDYSVGDYSGMAKKIHDLAKLFLNGEAAVIEEFSQVFESCLTAKLSTETGRAYVASKLTDAAQATDPSVVANAPVAGTV